MSEPTCKPTPESHWYPSDVAAQPPRDLVVSLQCLVRESRGRLGPGTDPAAVLADLRARDLDVTIEDVRHVWEELT
jgi:hypothetical protein